MGRRGDRCAPCLLRSEEGEAISTFCKDGHPQGGHCWDGHITGMGTAGIPWPGWPLLVCRSGRGDRRPERSRAPGTPGRISGRSADAALPSPLFALRCLCWCVNKGGFVIKQRWLLSPALGEPSPGPARTGGAVSVPWVSSLPYCWVENGSAP